MATTISKTVAPSGGDFTSLSAAVTWFKNNYPNFVTSDIIGVIQITGSWSSPENADNVSITSLTTDATHYLHIYTDATNKASASWSNSKYRLTFTNDNVATLNIGTSFVIIDGLQISNGDYADATAVKVSSTLSSDSKIILRNLLIKGPGTATNDHYGISIYATNANVYAYNCVIYNYATTTTKYIRPVWAYTDTSCTLTMYNCIAIGGDRSFRLSSGSITLKNCYAANAGTACYDTGITLTTCASSDTTGSTGLQNISLSNAGFVNVQSGSEDFHLASTSSPLYHTGTDTSGDSAPMNFTTDLDGQNYYDTGGVRSIGVDEYIETGPPSGPYRSVWVNFSWS